MNMMELIVQYLPSSKRKHDMSLHKLQCRYHNIWIQLLGKCAELFWHGKGMKKHGTPDVVPQTSWYQSSIVRHCVYVYLCVCVCVCVRWLRLLQSHPWKALTPLTFRNFLILARLPVKMICRLRKRLTGKDRPTHPHSWPAIGKFQVNN